MAEVNLSGLNTTATTVNSTLAENHSTVPFPTNTSILSTTLPVTTNNELTSQDIVFKIGLSLVIFGALFLCALAFIFALWYTKQKIKATINRQQSTRNYTYDNQVDILHTETSDTIALERAFGTGVLVIQDSPIVRQRERLTSGCGTGTGPTGRSGYMSTAESDTEQLNV